MGGVVSWLEGVGSFKVEEGEGVSDMGRMGDRERGIDIGGEGEIVCTVG